MRLTTKQAMLIFLPAGLVMMFIASRFFHFFSTPGLLSAGAIYLGLRYIIKRHVIISEKDR